MRILTRNTVFKTAVLTGLLSCLLVLAGAFFGTTVSVHAMHGFTHADEVGTEAELKQFVEDAVDAYYIDFIIKSCDFSDAPFASLITVDLATATIEEIKPLIPLFPAVGLTSRSDIEPYCDFTQRFDQVFDKGGNREEGDWKAGSIYLFIMDDQGKMLFHGDDPDVEGIVLAAEDEGGRDVRQLIIDEAETPSNAGIVQYCWDNPDVPGDEILDSNGNPIEGKAPGDSWKKSYVVDPFVYLGAPALSGSPGVIFGSDIYPDPETGNAPSGCDGNGMADYDGDGMDGDGMDGDGMDGDGMDGDGMDGDGMDGDGDDIVDTIKDVAESGGCTIAAGSDNTPRSNAFNLLLIVSALFLAVSFGSRAMDKRNGVRS